MSGPAETCLYCEEPLLPGEARDHTVSRSKMHHECGARVVLGSLGHLRGKCGCYGGTEDDPPRMTKRQAARAALNWFRAMGVAEPEGEGQR